VGKGTTISIRLPLTLSIMDGLLTQVEDTYFVFPLNLISRIDKVPYQEVNKEGKFSRSLLVEGKQMSVLSLREAFRIDSNSPEKATIVSIQYGESIKGIVVDKVNGEMQAVLKPLGSMYEEQDYISGSTILGDGNLALVLDTNKLLSRFAKS
jgi:two-component system chemotaxis sensor kinase CheA